MLNLQYMDHPCPLVWRGAHLCGLRPICCRWCFFLFTFYKLWSICLQVDTNLYKSQAKSQVRSSAFVEKKHICKSLNICWSWYVHLQIIMRRFSLHGLGSSAVWHSSLNVHQQSSVQWSVHFPCCFHLCQSKTGFCSGPVPHQLSAQCRLKSNNTL